MTIYQEELKRRLREEGYYCRGDFVGVMKLDKIPEWAQEKYAEITGKNEETEEIEPNTSIKLQQ